MGNERYTASFSIMNTRFIPEKSSSLPRMEKEVWGIAISSLVQFMLFILNRISKGFLFRRNTSSGLVEFIGSPVSEEKSDIRSEVFSSMNLV